MDRDYDIGQEVRRTPAGRMVVLSMTEDQFVEALGDAVFTAGAIWWGPNYLSLRASAKRAEAKLRMIGWVI